MGGGAYTLNKLQKKISMLCFERHPERQVPILRPTCWINYSYVPNVKLSMQKYSKFTNKFMWHARSYEEFSMILSKNRRSKCKTNHRHQHVAITVSWKMGTSILPGLGPQLLASSLIQASPKLPPNPQPPAPSYRQSLYPRIEGEEADQQSDCSLWFEVTRKKGRQRTIFFSLPTPSTQALSFKCGSWDKS